MAKDVRSVFEAKKKGQKIDLTKFNDATNGLLNAYLGWQSTKPNLEAKN